MTSLASRKKYVALLARSAAEYIAIAPDTAQERGDLLDEFERTFYAALQDAKQARGDEGVLRQVAHVGARVDTP